MAGGTKPKFDTIRINGGTNHFRGVHMAKNSVGMKQENTVKSSKECGNSSVLDGNKHGSLQTSILGHDIYNYECDNSDDKFSGL
jgi:hypothetical protein